ncbi:MAG: VPLPA-CTERM sorting domain-containing protein [Pseudomonadota bacterium]
MEWDMIGMRQGMSGLALAAMMALPQAATASALFDIGSNIGIELAAPVAPGTGTAAMSFQNFAPVEFGAGFGDTGFAGGAADFNPFFGSAPQDGGPAVDLGLLVDEINPTRPTLGSFAVGYSGFANSGPGVGASLDTAGSDSFFLGSSGAQTYDFMTAVDTTLDLVISPVVLFNDLSADPGSSVASTGRYLVEDSFSGDEYIVTVTGTPDGFGGVDSAATLAINGAGPIDLMINGANTVVNMDGTPISIPIFVTVDGGTSVKFSFEAIGELRAAPGDRPGAEVPVPAALPLLATAMGGLFWMRRRKPS